MLIDIGPVQQLFQTFSRQADMTCTKSAALQQPIECAYSAQTFLEGSTGAMLLNPGDGYSIASGAAVKFGNMSCTIRFASQPVVSSSLNLHHLWHACFTEEALPVDFERAMSPRPQCAPPTI